MNFPNELKYTADHEWVRINGNEAVIGITDFAQSELVIKLANLSAFTKAEAHQSEEHTAEHFIIGTVPYLSLIHI